MSDVTPVLTVCQKFRQWMRAQSSHVYGRYELLLWAYFRGWPHERVERRVREDNLPLARLMADTYYWSLEGKLPGFKDRTPELEAFEQDFARWCDVPPERVKTLGGPRVLRPRPVRPSRAAE